MPGPRLRRGLVVAAAAAASDSERRRDPGAANSCSRAMLTLYALALAARAASAAVLYRALTPVSENETALFAGAGLDGATGVRFCDGAGACATAPLLARASLTVRAAVPAGLARGSTLAATVLDGGGGALAAATLNAPLVDWFHGGGGAMGDTLLLGQPLRLLGRALAWGGGACLPFTRQTGGALSAAVRVFAAPLGGGARVPLRVTFASCYRVDVDVPAAGLVAGAAHALLLDNGLRGPGLPADGAAVVVARVVFAAPAWPPAEFRVNVSGAVNPSPGCATVAACLATAGAAGGGTVRLPAGVFTVCESWLFPDGVALVGAGRGATTVHWPAWCGTPVGFDPEQPNTSTGVPIVTGAPGARWRLEDVDLWCQATGGHGYQPPLGTDFLSLGRAHPTDAGGGGVPGTGSAGRVARVNITFDLRRTPAIQLGNAVAVYNSSGWALVDSFVSHKGSCSAQWPRNAAIHVSGSADGEVRGTTFDMGCQSAGIESSARIFLADNAFREVNVWPGVGSSNGGFEMSTIDAPHVSEHHYFGNNSYVVARNNSARLASRSP